MPSGNTKPIFEVLDRDEALRLIAPGGVGRVGFEGIEGPLVLPVNYRVEDGGAIVFRTADGGTIDLDLRSGIPYARLKVAFEVDYIDDATKEGWSVLVRGGATRLEGAERDRAEALDVTPWASGEREAYIRVSANEVTGRRVRRA